MSQFGWIKKLELSGEQDDRNKKGLIESYIVEGYAPLTIMNKPEKVVNAQGVSLPEHGANFPDDDTATLDAYVVVSTNVTTGGALVTEVEARYSNDRRFGSASPPVNRMTPGVQRTTFQREKLGFQIPFGVRGKIEQQGTGILRDDWAVKFRTVEHVIFKWVKTVVIAGFTEAMLEAIELENDKLHFFNGRWWLFESGDAIPVEDKEKTFEVEYIWAGDPGTTDLGFSGPTSPLNIAFPQDRWEFMPDGSVVPGSTYIRPPHHEIMFEFALGHTRVGPVFPLFLPKTIRSDGWRNLPGIG